MSFSSLLSEIKNKSKSSESKPSYSYNPNAQTKGNTSQNPIAKPSQRPVSSYTPQRTVDPAVQRLKELRRLENAKKEASNPKPKTQRARTSTSSTSRAPAVRRRKTPEVSIKPSVLQERPRSSSPQKRLTFAELMSQAQEKSKALASKEEQPQQVPTQPPKFTPKTQPKATQSRNQRSSSAPSSAQGVRRTPIASSNSRPPSRPSSRPLETVSSRPKFAQPSAKLQAKLDAKRKRQQERKSRANCYEQEEDSYESDFIVDDEDEEQEEEDYDRDEIWKMFNRGKSRSDYVNYDDDLSDMEATGSEVLNEEMRSAKRARLEERAEAERERRRIEEKRRRLGKK